MNVRLCDSKKYYAVKRRVGVQIGIRNLCKWYSLYNFRAYVHNIYCVLLLCRGYVEAVREIEQQIQISGDVQFDDIVVSCGRYFSNTQYSLLVMGQLCVCTQLLCHACILNTLYLRGLMILYLCSGGTIAGLALGSTLSSLKAKVWAFFVIFLSRLSFHTNHPLGG